MVTLFRGIAVETEGYLCLDRTSSPPHGWTHAGRQLKMLKRGKVGETSRCEMVAIDLHFTQWALQQIALSRIISSMYCVFDSLELLESSAVVGCGG